MKPVRIHLRHITLLAESIGFEPMRHFRNDGLANRSFNHSGNSPIMYAIQYIKNKNTPTLIPNSIQYITICSIVLSIIIFAFDVSQNIT